MASPAPTEKTTMAPPPTPTERPKTIWIISGLIIIGVIGIVFLIKKSNRSHTPNNKKQYKPKDYDSNDYRDDH